MLEDSILTHTLCDLLPLEKRPEIENPTIFIYDKRLFISEELAKYLVDQGVSKKVHKLTYPDNKAQVYSNQTSLLACEAYTVSELVPMTETEFEQNLGTLSLSILYFNKTKTHARFIYQFLETFDKCKKQKFEYVETTYNGIRWEITKRLPIQVDYQFIEHTGGGR